MENSTFLNFQVTRRLSKYSNAVWYGFSPRSNCRKSWRQAIGFSTFDHAMIYIQILYLQQDRLFGCDICESKNNSNYFKYLALLLVDAFPLRKKCPTIAVTVCLLGAFPLREKCPTIAVTVCFQTTILTLIGPLCRNNPETTPNAKSRQGKLSPKGPLSFFTFSRKPTKPGTCLKGPPFGFFSALCDFFS